MGEATCSVDRISELPDFILHHIFSFLTTKEAARTGVVSKRWRYVSETFPILDCNELYFGRDLDILNPKEIGMPKVERRKIFNQRTKFMNYVDEKLQRFHEENLSIKEFFLHMTLVSNNLTSRVDAWTELVSNMCVEELQLFLTLGRERFYVLPLKILAMETLTFLSLRGCLVSSGLNSDAIKLTSLIQLHLRHVFINDETIQDLIFSLRSLEVFCLKNCVGFKNVEICGHDKLKKMVYHSHKDLKVKRFSINLPALEELDFCSFDKDKAACEIIVSSACENLRRLSLCGIPINTKWLQGILSSFPLVEQLLLGGCVLEQVVKLSSSALKVAYLCNCKNLIEAEFDTPNMHLFQYHGKKMPRLNSKNITCDRVAGLHVRLRNMDSSWFLKLHSFLRDNKFQDFTLSMIGLAQEIPFIAEEFMGIQFTPFKLNNMNLVALTHELKPGTYADLLDGLLWNIRPQILSLELNFISPEVVKGLLKSLVDEDRNCCCSKNNHHQCWRHSLKNVTVINLKGFESNAVLDKMTLKKFTDFLDRWAIQARNTVECYGPLIKETLCFHLSW